MEEYTLTVVGIINTNSIIGLLLYANPCNAKCCEN